MSSRLRLARSIPFWILVAGSLAAALYGTLVVVDKTSTMTTTLTDGSATGIEVYAGQAWVTFGAALVGAGLVGLVAALFLIVAASFVPAPAVEIVEPIDGADETAEPSLTHPAAEPAVTDAAEAADADAEADAPADASDSSAEASDAPAEVPASR